MRLLSKYNRVNVFSTTIVLLLSAICYYFFIRNALVKQLDKDLIIEEREVLDFVKENKTLPESYVYKDEQEEFHPAPSSAITRSFSSVELFNVTHGENITYRQLRFIISADGKNYEVFIRKSQEETEDLIQLVLKITLLTVVALLVSLFLVNRFLLRKLWEPFNTTLAQMKQFNLSGGTQVVLENSDIDEFTELNGAVNVMTNRVSQDFDEIKNFTENASHEIQTPLAIINSKLELLSQSENLKEEQMNTIQSIFEAGHRLAKLNQSLILLTKIDNKQFRQNGPIDFSLVVHKHMDNFEELVAAKQIMVSCNIENGVQLLIHENLADVLVSNLVTNAIKHNIEKGTISITLTSNEFSVSNTGEPLDHDPAELFERFRKGRVSSESQGLGLSIAKKICEQYNFQITYSYADLLHTIKIMFNENA
ncbi:MAG: HAMP domain-containing sensor histidine kinase [Ginsengibacter sp.]